MGNYHPQVIVISHTYYQRDHTESLGICFEHDIAWNGHSFLVIYGKHINGHYIAIPNWGVCCEAGYPQDSFYNTERLSRLDLPEGAAGAIASYIEEAVEVVDELVEKLFEFVTG